MLYETYCIKNNKNSKKIFGSEYSGNVVDSNKGLLFVNEHL